MNSGWTISNFPAFMIPYFVGNTKFAIFNIFSSLEEICEYLSSNTTLEKIYLQVINKDKEKILKISGKKIEEIEEGYELVINYGVRYSTGLQRQEFAIEIPKLKNNF